MSLAIPRFPSRLHYILDKVDPSIVSWPTDEDDNSFKIHNRDAFIHDIMPHYFPSQADIKSFMGKLRMWGFKRTHGNGPKNNGYYFQHPLFVRHQPLLCHQMVRRKFTSRASAARQKKEGVASARNHATTPSSLPPPQSTKEQETLSSSDVREIRPFPLGGSSCPLTKGDSDITREPLKQFFLDTEAYDTQQHEQEPRSLISGTYFSFSSGSAEKSEKKETQFSCEVRPPFPVGGSSCPLTKGDSDFRGEPPKHFFLDNEAYNEEYDAQQHQQKPRPLISGAPFSFNGSAENSEKKDSCEVFFDDLKYVLIGLTLGGDPLFDSLLTPNCQT